MTTIHELIERVEKLTGPDREVDCQIAYAVGWDHPATFWREWAAQAVEHNDTILAWASSEFVPTYTASLDAALTLVPEGWFVDSITQRNLPLGETDWLASLWTPTRAKGVGCSPRPTPAIALCIAALHARAEQEKV